MADKAGSGGDEARDLPDGLKRINGVKVLDSEGGNRFYHRHKSPKARRAKKKKRKAARASRRK